MDIQWDRFTYHIKMRDRLVGGVPFLDPSKPRVDVVAAWVGDEKMADDLAGDPDLPIADEPLESTKTGFKNDGFGIYVEARQVKALIREASSRLGFIKRVKGMRQVIQHDVMVREAGGTGQKLYIMRDRLVLEHADAEETRAISVMTRQGPRSALKTFDYVNEAEVMFDIGILRSGIAGDMLDEEKLTAVMEYGCELGLGADRSQGAGTFDIVSVKKA